MPELINELHDAGFSGDEAVRIIKELQTMSYTKQHLMEEQQAKNNELDINYVTVEEAHTLPEFTFPKSDSDEPQNYHDKDYKSPLN